MILVPGDHHLSGAIRAFTLVSHISLVSGLATMKTHLLIFLLFMGDHHTVIASENNRNNREESSVIADDLNIAVHPRQANTGTTSPTGRRAEPVVQQSFDKYATGLGRLLSLLSNLNTDDLQEYRTTTSAHSQELGVLTSSIDGLFAYVRTMQLLKERLRQESDENTGVLANEILPTEAHENLLPLAKPEATRASSEENSRLSAVREAVSDLSQVYSQYFGTPASDGHMKNDSVSTNRQPDDSLVGQVAVMEALAQAHANNLQAFTHHPNDSHSSYLSAEENLSGLKHIIKELKELAGYPEESDVLVSVTTTSSTTTAPTTATKSATTTTTTHPRRRGK